MPSSQFNYIAHVNVYGVEKTFEAPSMRQLGKMLGISHKTTYKLAKEKRNDRFHITLEAKPKFEGQEMALSFSHRHCLV